MSDGASPSEHPANWPDERLLAVCRVTRTRRSGPGGQHRNKVETAIVLVHEPSGLKTEASATRSQAENLRNALRQLRLELAIGIRLPDPGEPSPLWRGRCAGGRVQVRTDHSDFPALLAEALDFVASDEFNVAAAAQRLQCSTTQLVRFLDQEPRALAWVNTQRRHRELRPLRP